MINVIALDIDGVLNNDFTEEITANSYTGIDDYLVERLAKIVNATNAQIILTSSWKDEILFNTWEGDYLIRKLENHNLSIDFISEDDATHRGKFLLNNLDKYYGKNNYNYVVLDDCKFDYDELNMQEHLILTRFRTGLTEEDVEKAIEVLNESHTSKW